ncbi:inositol monophosphatase family protein, partial [Gordonia alkanivorans]|uniref:inositol monophosphatase family protein n=1 Tax=Gordonia alkanivorans TaxID=84096 RepID=UPI0039C6293A
MSADSGPRNPSTSQSYDDDLELALSLADSADALTTDRFGAVDLRVDDKPDLTPVSDADLACETLIRERLPPR